MANPDSSMILLLPVGDEFSTVSAATHATFVDTAQAVPADKELLCKWLFNAKRISVRTLITGSSPSDVTDYFDAGKAPSDIATDHPFPFNEIDGFDGSDFSCPAIAAQPNHTRWVPLSDNFFYVFVFNGVWYWTPGVFFSGQTVSPLGDTSFSVTWTDWSGDIITITTTIIDLFYP